MTQQTLDFNKAQIMRVLSQISDPEIPVLSLAEMGILRDVELRDNTVVVLITPTYSGCPAIEQISSDISQVLSNNGYPNSQVELVLSPAWTTDWMSEQAKQKLLDYGIAPPCRTDTVAAEQTMQFGAICPQCRSTDTICTSQFGSTACKALYKCNRCLEPFDYFKPI